MLVDYLIVPTCNEILSKHIVLNKINNKIRVHRTIVKIHVNVSRINIHQQLMFSFFFLIIVFNIVLTITICFKLVNKGDECYK